MLQMIMIIKAIRDRWQRLTIDWLVHHFLLLVSVLCDYQALMRRYAGIEDTATRLEDSNLDDAEHQLKDYTLVPVYPRNPTFMVRPTVILRLVVPSSGYSVLVRALLDTGTSHSVIFNFLAKQLVTKVCVCVLN